MKENTSASRKHKGAAGSNGSKQRKPEDVRTPEQGLLFGSRFLESFAGPRLLAEPRFAVAELIANAWDAGATRVEIAWPEDPEHDSISVKDNGVGMTEDQFLVRWRTLAYDRTEHQGSSAEMPDDAPQDLIRTKRRAFGKNGVGRFAAFCFADAYEITTRRANRRTCYRVSHSSTTPLELEVVRRDASDGHGTEIRIPAPVRLHRVDADDLRKEIGLRFLSDPAFRVEVNGTQVGFDDIPEEHYVQLDVDVADGRIEIVVFDTQSTDRTVKHHGIAWHVNGRLVGDCSWRGFTDQAFIDGRKAAAKRYTFIVRADCLAEHVEKDWSSFKDSERFTTANDAVSDRIRTFLLDATREQREEVLNSVREAAAPTLLDLSPRQREKWESFVKEAQEACPSISPKDLKQLGGVLANLEQAESKYALINKLHELEPHQLDQLHAILRDWTLDMAREVLDELRMRLRLVAELKQKAFDEQAREVQELQPIFARGLWIFGPEFETIHFTSNETMTSVVQRLFAQEVDGSRHRPDFVVLPDGSVGLYSYPCYDDQGGEAGIDKVVIVELKRAGVSIGAKEKDQCWKYVKELFEQGLLDGRSRVNCFVLGSKLDALEASPRTEMAERVVIAPMHYDTVLARANSRLLKLYDRVKAAPFLKEAGVDTSLDVGNRNRQGTQQELFDTAPRR